MQPSGATIVCHLLKRKAPVRDPKSSVYVPEDAFGEKHYPPYCSSHFAMFSAAAADALWDIFEDDEAAVAFGALPDVYFGIVASRNYSSVSLVDGKSIR